MLRRALLVSILLLATCRNQQAGPAFDRAVAAVERDDFRGAAKLFAEAARTDEDPLRRERAGRRLANIEWRIFHDPAAARTRLQRALAGAREPVDLHLELARIAAKAKDFAAARAEAEKAIAAAKSARERRKSMVARAVAIVEARDLKLMPEAIAALREVIAVEGPMLRPSRILARAGILANDGVAALEGIDGYYHVSQYAGPPQVIAAPYATVTRLMPRLASLKPAEREELGQALAGIRFFNEAALFGNRELVAYAATLKRIEELTNEYYRQIALGNEDDDVLRDGVKKESRAIEALGKRFGLYTNVGKTGTHVDLHMAHVVVDRALPVEQYGRRGTVRFVALDAVVSNGYHGFRSDGASGDGGWGTAKEIYQVRPLYADGALRQWLRIADPELRAKDDREIAEETARDAQRTTSFPGLALRLERQYLDRVRAETRDRDAFLARIEKEEFEYSIVLHEGRHAIDDAAGERFETWELEYRAKLSQIALAAAARAALSNVLGDSGNSPHAKANEKLLGELEAWMRANRAAIAGLDASAPLLPQLDRLTDDQMRAAVRSLDPFAR